MLNSYYPVDKIVDRDELNVILSPIEQMEKINFLPPPFPEQNSLTEEFINDYLCKLEHLPSLFEREGRSEEFMEGVNSVIDILYNYVQAYVYFKD